MDWIWQKSSLQINPRTLLNWDYSALLGPHNIQLLMKDAEKKNLEIQDLGNKQEIGILPHGKMMASQESLNESTGSRIGTNL